MTLLENGHLSEDAIELYSMARLDETLMEAFEEHLLLCEACQNRLEETDQFIHAYRTVAARAETEAAAVSRPDPAPAQSSRWAWLTGAFTGWRPLYAMGGALAAAALVIALVPRGPQGALIERSIELQAVRGSAPAVLSAPAASRLNLTLDITGLPAADPLRVAVARESGGDEWSTTVERPASEKISVKPNSAFGPGLYWIRIYGPDNALLREYGLELKK